MIMGITGYFFGLFLAIKVKHCLTINEYGVTKERKAFKAYQDANRVLETQKKLCYENWKTNKGSFTSSWKKMVEHGVYTPSEGVLVKASEAIKKY